LVTREKSFIKVTYEHPRDINGLANSHKVVPEVGALNMVGAGIDTSAGCGCIPTAHGVLVGIKDNGSVVCSCMLKKP
jgi:hypothetical protein